MLILYDHVTKKVSNWFKKVAYKLYKKVMEKVHSCNMYAGYRLKNNLKMFLTFIFKALIRHGKKINVVLKKYNATKNEMGHKIIKLLINLALIPPDRIQEGLTYIKKLVQKDFPNNNNWKKFIKYYEDEWIGRVTAGKFSVYKAIHRTNNHAESYHRTLNKDVGAKPGPKKFYGDCNFALINFKQ